MYSMAELYLMDRGGSIVTYHQCLSAGHRLGQAFLNALCDIDQARLCGSLYDPFYAEKDAGQKVEEAIQWLLDTEPASRQNGINSR